MEQRNSPYASEVILYRTRTEILTDQRIITGGMMVPLRTVSTAYVSPTRYFVPLQAARLIALLGAVLVALTLVGLVGSALTVFARVGYLVVLALLGAFSVLAPQFMPTHMVVLQTSTGVKRFLYSHDPGHLQAVVDEINNAAAQVRPPEQR